MYQLHPDTGSSQRILANLVLKAARNPVLDVGAAEGYLGRLGQLAAERASVGEQVSERR